VGGEGGGLAPYAPTPGSTEKRPARCFRI